MGQERKEDYHENQSNCKKPVSRLHGWKGVSSEL